MELVKVCASLLTRDIDFEIRKLGFSNLIFSRFQIVTARPFCILVNLIEREGRNE